MNDDTSGRGADRGADDRAGTYGNAMRAAVERNRQAYVRLLIGGGPDRLILTASSEIQAEGYREEIAERQSLAMLPPGMQVTVVPDPPGEKVGSGGATLHALRRIGVQPGERVLLLHCGGESRRLPAYGPQGKLFAPLPCPRPDGRASAVFDEVVTSLLPLATRMPPGWLVAAADILLLFDAAAVSARGDAVTGLGFPTDVETALGHGIYLPGPGGTVESFLQKPSREALRAAGGIRPDGTAIVDTGVFIYPAAVIDALRRLCDLDAASRPSDLYEDWVLPLVPSSRREAFLASGDPEIRAALWETLRPFPLSLRIPETSRFIHLGSTAQWREALLGDRVTGKALAFDPAFRSYIAECETHEGSDARGPVLLTSFVGGVTDAGRNGSVAGSGSPAGSATGSGAPSETVPVAPGAPGRLPLIAPGAVVDACRLSAGSRIDAGAVAVGVSDLAGRLRVPAGYAVDQLPISTDDERKGWMTRVYPVEMDPKATGEAARFFGHRPDEWLARHRLTREEVWPWSAESGVSARRPISWWTARLFPIASTPGESLALAEWLLECARDHRAMEGQRARPGDEDHGAVPGADAPGCEAHWPGSLTAWRAAARLSFEDCQGRVDREALRAHRRDVDEAAFEARIRRAMSYDEDVRRFGCGEADVGRARQVLRAELAGEAGPLKAARAHWLLADLMRSLPTGRPGGAAPADEADAHAAQAFAAVARALRDAATPPLDDPRSVLSPGEEVVAEAPARLDFAGAWSDTPPYCLEHGGSSLNAALMLDGRLPLRVRVRPLADPILRLRAADLGAEATITRLDDAMGCRDPRDPLALHKGALAYMGIIRPDGGSLRRQMERLGWGLEVVTESAVPKGSGLGTSSILGGMLLAAIGRAAGVHLDALALFPLVLDLEQRLTTGGGWQDQMGGLVGGWKWTHTAPGALQRPDYRILTLSPEADRALRERCFIFYTGYSRLARNLLRNMVGSYLSRDAATLRVLHGLRAHVDRMADALVAGDIHAVGEAMDHNSRDLAEIDPGSWPPHLLRIVEAIRPHISGAKLAGAAGGGFMAVVAKSAADRERAEATLAGLSLPPGARAYPLEVAAEGLRVSVRRA